MFSHVLLKGIKIIMANWRSIMKKIKRAPKTLRVARNKAKRVFEREKEIFINNFESHPVSREIQDGPHGDNISHTLAGYGNLFSFIGFAPGSTPVADVSHMLRLLTKFKKIKANRGLKNTIEITLSIPTLSDFQVTTPMPWESGRSWVVGIERGISGFGSYMYKKTYGNEYSRSGPAFQVKKPPGYDSPQEIRAGSFRNVKYMSNLIIEFYKNLKRQV